MIQEQFIDKVRGLHKNNENMLNKCLLSFIDSNGKDIEFYEDDYLLPKLFMSAFGKKITKQHHPMSEFRESEIQIDDIYRVI